MACTFIKWQFLFHLSNAHLPGSKSPDEILSNTRLKASPGLILAPPLLTHFSTSNSIAWKSKVTDKWFSKFFFQNKKYKWIMKLQYLNPVAKAMVPQMNFTGNFSTQNLKLKEDKQNFMRKNSRKINFYINVMLRILCWVQIL